MPEAQERNGGWGRIAIAATISILAASGFWNFIYKEAISRAEVQMMIQQSGPYVEDRKAILQRLDSLKEGQTAMSIDIQQLRGEIRAERKH